MGRRGQNLRPQRRGGTREEGRAVQALAQRPGSVWGLYFQNNEELEDYLQAEAVQDPNAPDFDPSAPVPHKPAPLLYTPRQNLTELSTPIELMGGFGPLCSLQDCRCLSGQDPNDPACALPPPTPAGWHCEDSFGGPVSEGWVYGSVLDDQAPALIHGEAVPLATQMAGMLNSRALFFASSSDSVQVTLNNIDYDYVYEDMTPADVFQNTFVGMLPLDACVETNPCDVCQGSGVSVDVALFRDGAGGECAQPEVDYTLVMSTEESDIQLLDTQSFAVLSVDSLGKVRTSASLPGGYAVLLREFGINGTSAVLDTVGEIDKITEADTCKYYFAANLLFTPDSVEETTGQSSIVIPGTLQGDNLNAEVTVSVAYSESMASAEIVGLVCLGGTCHGPVTLSPGAFPNQWAGAVTVTDGAMVQSTSQMLVLVSGKDVFSCMPNPDKLEGITVTGAFTPSGR